MTMVTHNGGCHCRRVRFEVVAPAQIEVTDCNCSVCSKTGYLHLIVARSHPDGYSVNARCLDAGTVTGMKVTATDGVNWERSHPAGGSGESG